MPVTAKLSRKFYEKLGDDVTNELVEWFNQVDAAYRSELREINDRNWARFEAKLERGLAELRAEFHALVSTMESRLIRWMFVFWVGTLATVITLLKL